jgi:beta-phosphoglucomutase-like phosphatase (HAD superfamily)
MAMSGMIFDVDGTLVDTNSAHVEAWHRAFKRLGFEVPVERIMVEIGKGGDKLVPSILGGEAGAAGVWRDVGHLLADLDHALEIVSLAATAPEYPSTPTRPGAPYR